MYNDQTKNRLHYCEFSFEDYVVYYLINKQSNQIFIKYLNALRRVYFIPQSFEIKKIHKIFEKYEIIQNQCVVHALISKLQVDIKKYKAHN